MDQTPTISNPLERKKGGLHGRGASPPVPLLSPKQNGGWLCTKGMGHGIPLARVCLNLRTAEVVALPIPNHDASPPPSPLLDHLHTAKTQKILVNRSDQKKGHLYLQF